MVGRVVAVSAAATHTFSKTGQAKIRLLEGLGVEEDAHRGKTVKHRSRVRADPTQPNLRQVHLIHQELLDELVAKGFEVAQGRLARKSLPGVSTFWPCRLTRSSRLARKLRSK